MQSNFSKVHAPRWPRSIISNNGPIITNYGPLLPIIDLVILSYNGSIITVIIGNNDLVITCDNDVITDVIMSNNGDIITIIIGNNVVITG